MTTEHSPLRLLAMRPTEHSEEFSVTPARIEAAIARCARPLPAIDFSICPVEAGDLRDRVAAADVLIGSSVPRDAVRDNAGPLRLIQLSSAGYDHLYPLDWLPDAVELSTASGVHAPKLREWATMAFIMLHTGVPRFFTAQRRHEWKPESTPLVRGRKAMIFGTGGLGKAIAEAAVALGIEAVGVRRRAVPCEPFAHVVTRAEAEALLPEMDFVALATPLSAETRGMMDRNLFARMKPGAGFINVGRGGLVDQEALLEAMEGGRLGGAVIDVTTPEPLPEDSPLWDAPGLIITPHVSCDDPETYVHGVLDILCENLHRLTAGQAILNRVERD